MSYKDGFKEQTVAAGQNTKERDYWLKKLSGEITRTILPYEFHQPGTHEGKSLTAVLPFQISGSAYAAMLKISNKSDVRLHILLLTCWLILLHRYTAATDIIVGVPTYRQAVEGRLINTALALRNPVNGRMTIKELLMQAGQTILEANQNQNYPIQTLVYKLNLPDAGGDFPLFAMSILLEEIHDKHDLDHIKQNMIISFHKTDAALEGTIEYNHRLYSEEFMQRIMTHYRQIMESSLSNVETPINQVEMIPQQEKLQLLKEFNNNKADFPRHKIISGVIAEQAERTPDHIALVGSEVEEEEKKRRREEEKKSGAATPHAASLLITYAQLNQQSNHLAGLLTEKGAGPGTIVAIMMERSIEMIITILAIFKAGGVYLPIDPDAPQDRIDYMLKDSYAGILIHKSEIRNPKSETNTYTHPRRGPSNLNSSNLAYIIYTSGSTGKPKGAMVEHIGMMNHMWAKVRTLGITSAGIVAQTASPTFDISVWQFFAALTQGGRTVIYPDSIIMDPLKLVGLLIENKVTILELVPSYLSVLLDAIESQIPLLMLTYLLVTGEEIKPMLVNRWFNIYPAIKMINAYGPTEASDDITQHILTGPIKETQHVPIGKPLQNFHIFIVDEHMQLCPIGIKGEICVSGTGVGRGYLNRPELTAEKFIMPSATRNPFEKGFLDFPKLLPNFHSPYTTHHSPFTIYKTGDLGRWLPDGTIEFFGRKDYQVKIRGFRIELGEIENLLATHPAIKEAVVIDRENARGQKYLCAYYVPGLAEVHEAELKSFLSRTLPDYMLPTHFVKLPKMPLSPNGKIDRKALPEPASITGGLRYLTSEMIDLLQLEAAPGNLGSVGNMGNAGNVSENNERSEPGAVELNESEKHRILYEFNNTAAEFPMKTLHQLLAEQAEKTPGNIALTGSSALFPRQITYHELHEKSNRMAAYLRETGVRPGNIVGIMAARSLETIISIFAILKMGCAYLALSVTYPDKRLDFTRRDSEMRALLTDNSREFPNPGQNLLIIDITKEHCYTGSSVKQYPAMNDAAAVFYTSGSTGNPKGAVLGHAGLVNRLHWMQRMYPLTGSDIILQKTAFIFDVSMWELFWWMFGGAALYILPADRGEKPQDIVKGIKDGQVTMVHFVPTPLSSFLHHIETAKQAKEVATLKHIFASGETLTPALVEKFNQVLYTANATRLHNFYGPTEASIDVSYFDCPVQESVEKVPIGKPIDNVELYIVDQDLNPVPIGMAGELLISGIALAGGYLNRPELTAGSFFRGLRGAGFSKKAPLVYRTGDLARWLPDGNIEFLGRKDHQIQLKGIRVELGEIESILLKQKEISEAAVVARTGKDGEIYLRAAVVAREELTNDGLRERLAREISSYMIPSEFLQLEKMPLTPSGKINRRIIAAIEEQESGAGKNISYIAPETQLQMQIAGIWKEVLNVPKVGIHDNFFDLGGNSLGIILVNNKLKEKLQRDIPALILFEYPTIAGLSRYLEPRPDPDNVTSDNTEMVRTEIKNKGRDRMMQRKSKLKEERINQKHINKEYQNGNKK